jgi:hypothetical protein
MPERTADAVRAVIDRWVELLAAERFEDALALLAARPESALSTAWTSELPAAVIKNDGFVELHPSSRTLRVTPIATAVGDGPRFEVEWYAEPTL